MNGSALALALTLVSALALLWLPRRWAPAPLIGGACLLTAGQALEVGPFHFTFIRMLVLAGVVRVIARRERLAGGMNSLDWLIVLWSVWACLSSVFHQDPESALVFRLGMAYNACGIYFLLRIFVSSLEDVVRMCKTTALVLTLVAVAMLYEHATLQDVFFVFGGVDEHPMIREGRVRAAGPFAHPILAGTVGAVTLPLILAIWQYQRVAAVTGLFACLAMVYASGSSGPVMSTIFGIGALLLWRFRLNMRLFRWVGICGVVALMLAMKAPVYYLIARIDIVGGSTGWHRARLMESSIEHLSEWWLAGTDYTRHWMDEGIGNDPTQADITNHYIRMGVTGGLPLVLLFIWTLKTAFSFVGRGMRGNSEAASRQRFMFWALGCALFAHTATFVSVSYFDQSIVFLYINLAAIGSAGLHAVATTGIAESQLAQKDRVLAPGGIGTLPVGTMTSGGGRFLPRRIGTKAG